MAPCPAHTILIHLLMDISHSTEKDYAERLSRQAEQVADLQLQLDQLQAEKHRLTDQLESRIVDNSNRYLVFSFVDFIAIWSTLNEKNYD